VVSVCVDTGRFGKGYFLFQCEYKSVRSCYNNEIHVVFTVQYLRAYLVLKECLRLQPNNTTALMLCAKLCYEQLDKVGWVRVRVMVRLIWVWGWVKDRVGVRAKVEIWVELSYMVRVKIRVKISSIIQSVTLTFSDPCICVHVCRWMKD
jgi:hypothetical protein